MDKRIIGLISIIITFFLIVTVTTQIDNNSSASIDYFEGLHFSIGKGVNTQDIYCYYAEADDSNYLFLPAYASDIQVNISHLDCAYFTYQGTVYQQGDLFIDKRGKTNELIFYDKDGTILQQGNLKVYQSANIPCIDISTASGSMSHIYENKENKEEGMIKVLSETGDLLRYDNFSALHGRGNTSWESDKKGFELRFDNPVDMLGMKPANRFILLSNYYDSTYLRNKIGMDLGTSLLMGSTPQSQFVDLYINGNYAGLYQIMERIGLESNQTDVKSDYLLEIDYLERTVDKNYILLENKQPIVIKEWNNTLSDKELKQIENFFVELEEALDTDDFIHPKTKKHVFEYIDIESFSKRFIMDEFLQDMDFGFSSYYIYLSEMNDSLMLYAGPVWDLDNTMGRGTEREPLLSYANQYELAVNNISRWYARLYQNEDFYKKIAEHYHTYFRPELTWILKDGITQWNTELLASAEMDIARYGTDRSIFMTDSTREDHMDYLLSYLENKLSVMDQKWKDPIDYSIWNIEKQVELPDLEQQVRDTNIAASPSDEQNYSLPMTIVLVLFLVSFIFLIKSDFSTNWSEKAEEKRCKPMKSKINIDMN